MQLPWLVYLVMPAKTRVRCLECVRKNVGCGVGKQRMCATQSLGSGCGNHRMDLSLQVMGITGQHRRTRAQLDDERDPSEMLFNCAYRHNVRGDWSREW